MLLSNGKFLSNTVKDELNNIFKKGESFDNSLMGIYEAAAEDKPPRQETEDEMTARIEKEEALRQKIDDEKTKKQKEKSRAAELEAERRMERNSTITDSVVETAESRIEFQENLWNYLKKYRSVFIKIDNAIAKAIEEKWGKIGFGNPGTDKPDNYLSNAATNVEPDNQAGTAIGNKDSKVQTAKKVGNAIMNPKAKSQMINAQIAILATLMGILIKEYTKNIIKIDQRLEKQTLDALNEAVIYQELFGGVLNYFKSALKLVGKSILTRNEIKTFEQLMNKAVFNKSWLPIVRATKAFTPEAVKELYAVKVDEMENINAELDDPMRKSISNLLRQVPGICERTLNTVPNSKSFDNGMKAGKFLRNVVDGQGLNGAKNSLDNIEADKADNNE